MRLVVNEPHIEKRTKIGEIAPFVGLILLIAATALIFLRPDWTWATMIFIWVGFVISLVGGYLGNRYLGPLAHHKKVPEVLKGLENSFALLVYKTPVPFVLVDAGGLTTILVRSQSGQIVYRNGTWRHREKLGLLRRFAGQEGLGKPDRLAELEAEDLRRFLGKRLPEGVDVPVRPVILFVNPDAQIDLEETPPVPAFRTSELKRWLRRDGRRPKLSEAVQQQLFAALGIEV